MIFEAISAEVKDGENLEEEMAEETSSFEDMVTKDTASAIDKFTKKSEQLGVPRITAARTASD